MRQRPVNETFAHYTLGTLRVVEDNGNYGCQGCVFDTADRCTNDNKNYTGACSADERADGQGVIFVKVK